MSDVSEVKYAELHTRYREASMLADKYELIAKTHQDVNESLRKINDDLRRMLLEKDEENAKLRELVRDLYGLAWPECPGAAEAYLPRIQSLGVEVEG